MNFKYFCLWQMVTKVVIESIAKFRAIHIPCTPGSPVLSQLFLIAS